MWRLDRAPIRKDLVYDFFKGINNIDEMQIVVVKGQKVKITREAIFKMFLPCQGPNTKWPSPLQHGIPKMCKKLMDETIIPGKEGWLVMKMKGRYI